MAGEAIRTADEYPDVNYSSSHYPDYPDYQGNRRLLDAKAHHSSEGKLLGLGLGFGQRPGSGLKAGAVAGDVAVAEGPGPDHLHIHIYIYTYIYIYIYASCCLLLGGCWLPGCWLLAA